MSRRGNPYDNAKAESFVKTLKVEAVYLAAYETFLETVHRQGRTPVVGQYMCEAERERGRSLAQQGDSAFLGLVVLDGEVDGARAAVDGYKQIAFATFTIGGLQLWRMGDDESEVVERDGGGTPQAANGRRSRQ